MTQGSGALNATGYGWGPQPIHVGGAPGRAFRVGHRHHRQYRHRGCSECGNLIRGECKAVRSLPIAVAGVGVHANGPAPNAEDAAAPIAAIVEVTERGTRITYDGSPQLASGTHGGEALERMYGAPIVEISNEWLESHAGKAPLGINHAGDGKLASALQVA